MNRLNGVAHVVGDINKEELFGELPPPDKVKQFTVQFTWFHERFRMLPDTDASEDTIRIYARAYIMMLLPAQLFGDKSANRIFWRFSTLKPHGFDDFSFWVGIQIMWELYVALDVLVIVHPEILAEQHSPSTEFLDWWYHVAHMFLSPDAAFANPRGEEIPDDAFYRRLSQAPARVPVPDVPDSRRVERRRRIGTRATDKE
ncbi:hypothetical protein Ahy_A06g029602 [Arachis hypogaea]|uniref:Aminotransferase-like plant mobile domain-containing protein n=1 Tax=Arachis hypogaea TaxID=3818 RepID=A0A445CTW2_ARAHY|nr:hypothetical protein Ahy_A06g029602 [Arachis hypogaea]